MSTSNSSKIFNSEILDSISLPQYLAVKNHFENALESIKDDENLKEIVPEFSNVLRAFETCFRENQKKTEEILELRALNAVKSQREKSISPSESATVEDLGNELHIFQRNIGIRNHERVKLLKEVEDLKKTADKQIKVIQDHEKSLENASVDIEINCDLISYDSKPYKPDVVRKDGKRINSSENEHSDVEFKEKCDSTATLKNNLDILVLDLKLTRQKIEELKNKIGEKDALVKELNKDKSESEKKCAEYEKRVSNVREPLETKITKCKYDLKMKKEGSHAISETLEKDQLWNENLGVDISCKKSIIDGLKIKVEELEMAKESATRNVEVFERHLARSKKYNKELIFEIKTLKDEIQSLKHKVSKEVVINDKVCSETDLKEDINSQERSLKSHMILKDQELRQMEDELTKDFIKVNKEKSNLQSEIELLKKKLNDKTADVKYLKEKLCKVTEESRKIEREFCFLERNHQQIVEKSNKYHSMYKRIKSANNQQKKDNTILGKREEYLVKILKEKDIEIQKLITWRRYISSTMFYDVS